MSETTPAAELQDDLTLKLWEGDESAKAKLVIALSPSIEAAIACRFTQLSEVEIEDVVAEAIARLWRARENYDPNKAPLRAYLYKIAVNVANEYTAGRYNWQKARLLAPATDPDLLAEVLADDAVEEQLDALEAKNPELLRAVAEAVTALPDNQRAVIEIFAHSAPREVNAGQVGKELGEKLNGVPIPAGTIRQWKKRARDTVIRRLSELGFDLTNVGGQQ